MPEITYYDVITKHAFKVNCNFVPCIGATLVFQSQNSTALVTDVKITIEAAEGQDPKVRGAIVFYRYTPDIEEVYRVRHDTGCSAKEALEALKTRSVEGAIVYIRRLGQA